MRLEVQLKDIRQRLRESQATFAKRFGVDQSTIHRWETKGIPVHGAARKVVERFVRETGP